MKKLIIVLVILLTSTYGMEKVLLTKKNLQYKEILNKDDLIEKNTYKPLSRNCIPFSLEMLDQGTFITLHYIRKGSIICTKDVERYVRRSVKFDFGSFEIEKVGEIILETDDYVKIKDKDGRVEKIYKDGHAR